MQSYTNTGRKSTASHGADKGKGRSSPPQNPLGKVPTRSDQVGTGGLSSLSSAEDVSSPVDGHKGSAAPSVPDQQATNKKRKLEKSNTAKENPISKKKYEEVKEKIREQRKEIDVLQEDNKSLSADLCATKRALDTSQGDLKRANEDYQNVVNASAAEKKSLETDLDKAHRECAALKQEKSGLEQGNGTLKGQLIDAENENEYLENYNQVLIQERGELEKKVADLGGQVIYLTAEKESLTRENQELEAKQQGMNAIASHNLKFLSINAALRGKNEELDKELTELQGKYAFICGNNDNLTRINEGLKEQAKKSTVEQEALKEEVADLKNKVTDFTAQNPILQDNATSPSAPLVTQQADLAVLDSFAIYDKIMPTDAVSDAEIKADEGKSNLLSSISKILDNVNQQSITKKQKESIPFYTIFTQFQSQAEKTDDHSKMNDIVSKCLNDMSVFDNSRSRPETIQVFDTIKTLFTDYKNAIETFITVLAAEGDQKLPASI